MSIKDTHSGGVIRVEAPAGAWGALPLALLEDLRLGLDARAVAAWLATRPDGWQIAVRPLCKRLGLGRDRWQRIARELTAAGYLERRCAPAAAAGGRMVWDTRFTSVPRAIASSAPEPGLPAPAAPAPANPAVESYVPRVRLKKKREKQRPLSLNSTSTPNPKAKAEAGADAGAQPQRRGQGVQLTAEGVCYEPGNARDEAALQQLWQLPEDLVQEAAAAAAAADQRGVAWPGATVVIARRLDADRRRRERDAQQLAALRGPHTSTTDAGAGAARARLAALQQRMRGAKQ